MKETLLQRRIRVKAEATAALLALYEEMLSDDAKFQAQKPDLLKAIDAALTDHIFTPLFK